MSAIATPEQAFLDAIVSAPDDLTPRLMYADWLKEQSGTVPCGRCGGTGLAKRPVNPVDFRVFGETCSLCHGTGGEPDGRHERAEFIRVQIELANPPAVEGMEHWSSADGPWANCRCRPCDLRRRERDLLGEYWREWVDILPRMEQEDWIPSTDPATNPNCLFRRGFVEHVALTTADWIGTPCDRCRGSGSIAGNPAMANYTVSCPDCHGTGRVNAHGPALVRAAPLTSVRLTDRRPGDRWHTGGIRRFGWFCPEVPTADPEDVPEFVWKRLQGLTTRTVAFAEWRRWKWYNKLEYALTDLSRACLLHARSPEAQRS